MFTAINLKKLLTSLLFTLGMGLLGGFFTRNAAIDYAAWVKPPLAPPSYIFGIVWTILYILMGIAFYRIRINRNHPKDRQSAIILFILVMCFQLLWTVFFFTFNFKGFAAIWCGLLFVLTALCTIVFSAVDKTAAKLMLPTLIWTGFALYLNIGIWLLNR